MQRFARIDFLTVGYLVLCLLLGGASTQGYWGNLLLQFLGALLIAYCVWRPGSGTAPLPRVLRRLGIAVAMLAIVPLIPLPPLIWTALPGRAPLAEDFALLGNPLPWQTLSLSPWDSIASIVWWLPAVALLVVVRRADGPSADLIARSVLTVALASVALSAIQRSGGGLYPYAITNYGVGVGFFANANHQASFLLASLCLLAGLYAHRQTTAVRSDARRMDTIVFAALAVLLAGGVVLSNSLAGLGLLIPTAIGCVLIVRPDVRISLLAGVAAAVLVIAAIATIYAAGLLDQDLGTANGDALNRAAFNATGLRAALDFAPFGTGLGTFKAIYHLYEDPASVGTTYVNHAHNDLVELLVETGVLGAACLLLFLAWWVSRTIAVWRAPRKLPFPTAGALLTGIVLVHSLVDYPLRTAAGSGVFFLAAGLMLRTVADRASRTARHIGRRDQRAVHVMTRI